MHPEIDAIVARVLVDVSNAETIDPVVVRFLLSQYAATGREDLAAIVGDALAQALQQYAADPAAARRAEWLHLFADAVVWSDDGRVRAAIASLLASAGSGAGADVVDAALRGAASIGDRERMVVLVDDLERIIGRGYEPGDGVAAADQFAVASALLTAYDITGRLPYPMLAEELVRTAQRRGRQPDDVAAACLAIRVLCRLAALRADEDYLRAAVVAPDADDRDAAARLLARHASGALENARTAALYGLALAQWLGLH